MYSPTELDTHRKIILESTPLCPKTQKVCDELCNENQGIFSLHQGDISCSKLLTMDINSGDHPPSVHKSS